MKIDFIPSTKETSLIVEPPSPASKNIPKWYIDTPRFRGGGGPKFSEGRVSNNTVKTCIPFLDGISSGYIQKTWSDIHIQITDDGVFINYSRTPEIIEVRNTKSVETTDDFWPIEFTWKVQWLAKVPKGWSCLFTHPLNRLDLPFVTMSGIVDSDNFYHTIGGNYPFYLKKDFNNFIIPADTPMYQIVPIKRESWESRVNKYDEDLITSLESTTRKNFLGVYKKYFRQKKEYR